jgi:hypothetical protein
MPCSLAHSIDWARTHTHARTHTMVTVACVPRSLHRYVKLVVHQNHLNTHNWYNQAGIVAVNIIGDADRTFDTYGGGHSSGNSFVELNVGRLSLQHHGVDGLGGGAHAASLQHHGVDGLGGGAHAASLQHHGVDGLGGGAHERSLSASPWVSRTGGANMAMASGRIDYIGYGDGGGISSRGGVGEGGSSGGARAPFGEDGSQTLDLGIINKVRFTLVYSTTVVRFAQRGPTYSVTFSSDGGGTCVSVSYTRK